MPSSSAIHLPGVDNEQLSFPPFYSQGPSQYTGGTLSAPRTSGSPPVPHLRPASWGPPSWVDEAFERHQLARSGSSVDFPGDSGGEEEDLPFGGRTLPPLPILGDPWRSGARTMPSLSPTLPRDHSPGSEDLPATSSLPSTPFSTNYHYPGGEYG